MRDRVVEWPEAREPLITLDIDWAPEVVIDWMAQVLIDANVRATWFVTHESQAVNRLRRRSDLFESGIHPNFMAGSSHGATPIAVLRHCLDLVPIGGPELVPETLGLGDVVAKRRGVRQVEREVGSSWPGLVRTCG